LHDFFVEGIFAKKVFQYLGIIISVMFGVCHGFIQYYLEEVNERIANTIATERDLDDDLSRYKLICKISNYAIIVLCVAWAFTTVLHLVGPYSQKHSFMDEKKSEG
jgi:hypothetical protein